MRLISSIGKFTLLAFLGLFPYTSKVAAQTHSTTTVECAQAAVTAAAQAQATAQALNDRLVAAEKEISILRSRETVTLNSGATGNSNWSGGGANPVDAIASCPADQVVTGVVLHLGGTCLGQCNLDGRPVSNYHVMCGIPKLTK